MPWGVAVIGVSGWAEVLRLAIQDNAEARGVGSTRGARLYVFFEESSYSMVPPGVGICACAGTLRGVSIVYRY